MTIIHRSRTWVAFFIVLSLIYLTVLGAMLALTTGGQSVSAQGEATAIPCMPFVWPVTQTAVAETPVQAPTFEPPGMGGSSGSRTQTPQPTPTVTMSAEEIQHYRKLWMFGLVIDPCPQRLPVRQLSPTAATTTPTPSQQISLSDPVALGTDLGQILFDSDRSGNIEIYVMDPFGGNLINLTNHPTDDFQSDWSPDNQFITFASNRDGNDEIYVMNANGTGQQQLTFTTTTPSGMAVFNGHPAWSPDGLTIAFDSDRNGNSEIYLINADGSNLRQITSSSSYDGDPTWSPDGQRIAFVSSRDGNYEIYVMNADGSGVQDLTNHAAGDDQPAWSPDGQSIAFASSRDGGSTGRRDIYAMNADGTVVRRLTTHPEDEFTPSWSPDASQIAFDRVDARDTTFGWPTSLEVLVMDSDGANVRQLTNTTSFSGNPAWSRPGTVLPTPTPTPTPCYVIVTPSTGGAQPQAGDVCLQITATPFPTFTPTSTQVLTPTATNTFTTIDQFIAELATYGITAYKRGVEGQAWTSQERRFAQEWTFNELEQVHTGVQNVARAFAISRSVTDAKALFQRVMGPMYVLRVENGFAFADDPTCLNTVNQACTNNNRPAIAFYGAMNVTEYATAHEFGHRFNNQSDVMVGGIASESLAERMGASDGRAPVYDCTEGTDYIVFGNLPDSPLGTAQWDRGYRGWGSGPGFSNFQQHELHAHDWGKTLDEIDEAAADMFLNWVYRTLTEPTSLYTNLSLTPGEPNYFRTAACAAPAPDPSTWQGFQNRNWLDENCKTAVGCPDLTTKPGNIRYAWLGAHTSAIFVQHGW